MRMKKPGPKNKKGKVTMRVLHLRIIDLFSLFVFFVKGDPSQSQTNLFDEVALNQGTLFSNIMQDMEGENHNVSFLEGVFSTFSPLSRFWNFFISCKPQNGKWKKECTLLNKKTMCFISHFHFFKFWCFERGTKKKIRL